jgi:hypothetical protein
VDLAPVGKRESLGHCRLTDSPARTNVALFLHRAVRLVIPRVADPRTLPTKWAYTLRDPRSRVQVDSALWFLRLLPLGILQGIHFGMDTGEMVVEQRRRWIHDDPIIEGGLRRSHCPVTPYATPQR